MKKKTVDNEIKETDIKETDKKETITDYKKIIQVKFFKTYIGRHGNFQAGKTYKIPVELAEQFKGFIEVIKYFDAE